MKNIISLKFHKMFRSFDIENQASELVLSGQFEEAILEYTKSIKIEGHPSAILGRARAFLLLGDYDATIEDANILLENPNYPFDCIAHYYRGLAYELKGCHKTAMEDFEKFMTFYNRHKSEINIEDCPIERVDRR